MLTKPGINLLFLCVIVSRVTGECVLLLCWVQFLLIGGKSVENLFCVDWHAKQTQLKVENAGCMPDIKNFHKEIS